MIDRKTDNVGVYITSETAEPDPNKKVEKGCRISHEKFGFDEPEEILEYIKENAQKDDCYIVYTYEAQFGQNILKLLSYGNLSDLDEMK